MEKIYDVLIIGGGVAGMSASVYAKRAGKDVAIVERFALGGQVLQLEKIENFPSQTEIDGVSLAQLFAKQVKSLGVTVIFDEIKSVSCEDLYELKGAKGTYFAKKVIVATGMTYKTLGVNEEEFAGRGVSYCAVCDGNFYKGKTVAVASKKGSGIKDALYLSNVAKDVVLLDSEDMSIYEQANKVANLKVISNCKILSVYGTMKLQGVRVEKEGKTNEIGAEALFISLGKKAGTEILGNEVKLNDKGFVIVDDKMRSSAEGLYAIGDVRNGELKQIITACSDGAIAGNDS